MHVCLFVCACVFGKRGMRMLHGAGTDRQLDFLHDLLSVSAILLFLLLLPAFLHLVVGANTNERERECVCVSRERKRGEREANNMPKSVGRR